MATTMKMMMMMMMMTTTTTMMMMMMIMISLLVLMVLLMMKMICTTIVRRMMTALLTVTAAMMMTMMSVMTQKATLWIQQIPHCPQMKQLQRRNRKGLQHFLVRQYVYTTFVHKLEICFCHVVGGKTIYRTIY